VFKVICFIIALMLLQLFMAHFQSKDYKNLMKSLKGKGIIGIGVKKGRIRAGTIVILVSNEMGKIIEGKQMKGYTIFARFKDIEGVKGEDILELKKKVISEKGSIAYIDAIERIEEKLLKKNEEKLTEAKD
jgi:glucitol operon activator protein